MAAKYIEINREEMEDFLSSVSSNRIKRKGRTEGVYLLPLSKWVALRISSSIGSKGSVVGRGRGAIHLALESLVTGKPLATKKMKEYIGQTRINRTTSWKKRLKAAIQAAMRAYQDKKEFFDRIAQEKPISKKEIETQVKEQLEKIQRVPGWNSNRFLKSLRDRLSKGIPLTPKQKDALEKAISKAPSSQVQKKYERDEGTYLLLRDLYKRAHALGREGMRIDGRRPRDVINFITSLGTRIKEKPLTENQLEFLEKTKKSIETAEIRLGKRKQASMVAKTIELWSNRLSCLNSTK
jgi:hypothetical protein